MNILVTVELTSEFRNKLSRLENEHTFRFSGEETATREEVEWADYILGNVPITLLKEPQRLKCLQLSTSGADAYCKEGVLKEGTILCNATGSYGVAIAEYMVGVLLGLNGNLFAYRDQQMEHIWQDCGKVHSIAGSRILIVGLGDIGKEFAVRVQAFGASVVGIRRNAAKGSEYVKEVYSMNKLDELLPEADVVALCLPNTNETSGLINKKRLALMKKSAVLINVGRGSAVNTEDLYEAIVNGYIRGAALDVTDPEPLPSEHPLWSCKNVLITPHISGGLHAEITHKKVLSIMFHNLESYLKGKPLSNLVDFATGYRAD